MTTYDGRPQSFVPGKQGPNREPLYNAVGKKLLEKLYCVHRERVLKVTPTVDDKLEVFDFLTDQSWKLISRRHQELELMKKNEIFYSRLSKVENVESLYSKEMKFHMKHIKQQADYSQKLKEHSRFLTQQKINRDNEHMHLRLSNAQPFYSRGKMKKEYERVLFAKAGRRGDHTAGHLLQIPQRLAPPPLPKIRSTMTAPEIAVNDIQSKFSKRGSSLYDNRSKTAPSESQLDFPFPSSLLSNSSLATSDPAAIFSQVLGDQQRVEGSSYDFKLSKSIDKSVDKGSKYPALG